MAETWHTPPWEITGEPATPWRRWKWKERFAVFHAERLKKYERDKKNQERKLEALRK